VNSAINRIPSAEIVVLYGDLPDGFSLTDGDTFTLGREITISARESPFQFRTGFGYCFTGLFPGVLNTAQTERNAQHLFQQLPHYAARHPAHYGQIARQASNICSGRC
jgi:hypothetical protein